jgi:hypothetical protein
MKLKINKIFMKEPRIKIRKQKNKDWSWNTNNKEDQTIIFKEGERKKEKKKPCWRQTALPTRRGCQGDSNDMVERHF